MEKDNSSRGWTVYGNLLSWRFLDAGGWEAKTPTSHANKTKNYPQIKKKLRNLIFFNVLLVSHYWSPGGFSCSLTVLHGGLRINTSF